MSKINRRELLIHALRSGVGLGILAEQFGGVPFLASSLDNLLNSRIRSGVDAFQMMGQALAGQSSFFGVHQAMAAIDDPNDWSLVQIKVCNHIYAPLLFALGKLESNGKVSTGPNIKRASTSAGQAGKMLADAGVEEISQIERFKQLRLNRWFANILQNGTSDGLSPSPSNLLGLESSDVASFSNDVALQCFLGLNQVDNVNHSLKGCKLRRDLSDVTLFAHSNGLINSPLGISCFMMGNAYDQAEGAIDRNAVLGAGISETQVVASRTVTDYVNQVSQFVGSTYSDRESIEQNIVYRLDKLVSDDPKLRREMIASLQQFRAAAIRLRSSGQLESRVQPFDSKMANGQSSASRVTGATSAFLGQCKYVAQALEMPGMPLRNFSLFLNIVDLDGRGLDVTINNPNPGANEIRAYSYIEGMRQLAMGLNILGKKISEGKKIMVCVSSEGGRSTSLADSKVSCALVLGPRRAGMLDDALFADSASINELDSPIVVDSAKDNAAGNWRIADSLKERDGVDSAASVKPTTGDVQMGVIDFLEEMSGRSVRKSLSADNGRFVKLRRFKP